MTIKLYADEHVSKRVVGVLRNKGVDIISAEEAGNRGKSDTDQLKFAFSTSRCMLTMDSDYLGLKNLVGNCGIFFIGKRKSSDKIISKMLSLLEVLSEEDVKGEVVYV